MQQEASVSQSGVSLLNLDGKSGDEVGSPLVAKCPVASYKIVHALNQTKAGGRDSSGNTSVWSANGGLWRTGGTRGSHFPFERGGRKRQAGKTFDLSGISARVGNICRLGSDQQNRYLESAALIITFEIVGSMKGPTCVLLNICEELHQRKEIAWIGMKADRWTSC